MISGKCFIYCYTSKLTFRNTMIIIFFIFLKLECENAILFLIKSIGTYFVGFANNFVIITHSNLNLIYYLMKYTYYILNTLNNKWIK